MYDFLLLRLSLVLLTIEYSLMLNYNQQQILNQKVSSFLNVFFGALEQNQAGFVNSIPTDMFPLTQEEPFDFKANTYMTFPEDAENFVYEISQAHDMVMVRLSDQILCIQKLKDKDHYYGFRMAPARAVDSEWLSALHMLTTYATTVLKGRVRNTLITYQNAGYKIIPVSPTILEEKYNHAFKRAKAILA